MPSTLRKWNGKRWIYGSAALLMTMSEAGGIAEFMNEIAERSRQATLESVRDYIEETSQPLLKRVK